MPALRSRPLSLFFLRLAVLAGSLGLPAAAAAGPLTGRVVDPEDRPVPGARVLLVRNGTVAATTTTGGDGGFTIHSPDDGRLEIRVALDGFRAEPLDVAAEAASRDIGTIRLAVSAMAESVLVTASQVEVPLTASSASATVLTGDDLAARQADSLPDALRLVPGLAVAANGGRGALTGVFPRGGESDYSLVIVDEVPVNAFGGGFDFSQVALVDVERIEIVRGPQSALYGSNAIGSVVRVVTKRGGRPSGTAALEGGSFGTTRAAAMSAGSAGPWSWSASAERLASDGMNGRQSAAGETVANDDYERITAAGGGGWTHAGGAAVRASVRYAGDERGAPGPFGSDPAGFFEGVDTVSRGTNDRLLASVSAATPPRHRMRGRALASHSRLDGDFVSPFGASESQSRRSAVRLQADVGIADGLDGSAGAELARERAGSTFITAGASREVPIERSLAGFFGEARWSRGGRVYVTGGVRAERITRRALPGNPDAFVPRPEFEDDTVVSVNPKLAAAWFVRSSDGDYTKVRGSAGTGIRPPDAFEIAFTDNPALKPERSRSVDLGIEHALAGGRAVVEATTFVNEYDDLIIAVGSFNGSSRYRTDNISNARARGLELAASWRARWTRRAPVDLQARVAYTRLHTEILAVDLGSGAPPPFEVGDPLLRRPAHQFSTDVLLTAGRLGAFLQGGGRGRTLDTEPSTGTFGGLFQAAGYSVWNAGASWRVAKGVEVFGRVANLFGRGYEEVLGYPALPRGAAAGVRIAARR